MNIDENIKDTIKATAVIVVVVVLIVAGIGIYDAVTNPESKEIYQFLVFALILHNDLDENEVRGDILNLIDNISGEQVDNSKEIDSAITREASIIRGYKKRFYILVSPTDEMRALKESIVEEASLFLSSYYYLREALESKNNNDYNTCSLNVEKAIQYLNNATNLRVKNETELDQWKMKIEAELLN